MHACRLDSGLACRSRSGYPDMITQAIGQMRRRRVKSAELHPEPVESAKAAGLRWVNDGSPGLGRERRGNGFVYVSATGRRVSDAQTLIRIKSLAIPPAWERVWICPSPNGHIQASGYDARGRKQYRYHPRWREVRDEA